MKSDLAKELKAADLYPFDLHYGIIYNSPITFEHLMSIILYRSFGIIHIIFIHIPTVIMYRNVI